LISEFDEDFVDFLVRNNGCPYFHVVFYAVFFEPPIEIRIDTKSVGVLVENERWILFSFFPWQSMYYDIRDLLS
jgi:hypothetical protein